MIEKWKRIDGWLYDISSLGRVRNPVGKILKPRRHTNGYLRIGLSENGQHFDAYIHRLVCQAFHGDPPSPDCHAHHINKIRTDNRTENLQWLSPTQNRALRNFARGERSPFSTLTTCQVRDIRARPLFRGFDTAMAKELGVSRETVRDARLGKTWRHVDGHHRTL